MSQASAQISDEVRQAAMRDYHGDDMTGKDGPLAKAGLDLLTLYHAYANGSTSTYRAPQVRDAFPEAVLRDGHVLVDAVAATDADALKTDLEALGMMQAAAAGPMVSGSFPIEKIPELARLESLRSVQMSRPATRSTSNRSASQPSVDASAVPSGALESQPEAQPTRPPKASTDAEGQAAERQEGEEADDESPDRQDQAESDATEGSPSEEAARTPEMAQTDSVPASPQAQRPSRDVNAQTAAPSQESNGAGGAGMLLLILVLSLVLFMDV